MFACMAQALNLKIPCFVWWMLVVGLIDEMKNQHAQVELLDLCLYCENQTLASNVDLMGYSSFCVHVQLLMVLSMVYWCTPIGTRFKGPSLIPQHHLVDITLPHFLSIHTCNLLSKLLAHMQGELMLPIRVHETCPNPLYMVKMLRQATWIQIDFNSYLCESVVINYQKRRD